MKEISSRPPGFQVVIKPCGPICNLACTYCYYLEKQVLYPESEFSMSRKVLREFTRQYLQAQGRGRVTFSWQGGEPTLMGIDFFKAAFDYQRQYRQPGQQILNTLQTNGVLLDDEWCTFLKGNKCLVGLSLDGPRSLHNAYRVDREGNPTFDRVMASVQRLRKHAVPFNILACVHAQNVTCPRVVYSFFRDEVGADHLQFIPVVASQPNPTESERSLADYAISGPQYGAFLIAVFDEWVRHDLGSLFVQVFETALSAWAGRRVSLCVFQETCGRAPVLEHNGNLYTCDHYVSPEYLLGNIQEQDLLAMIQSDHQAHFGRRKQDLPSRCQHCEVRFICQGGCPKNRLQTAPGAEKKLNHLCEGYQAFFRHSAPYFQAIAEALETGQPLPTFPSSRTTQNA